MEQKKATIYDDWKTQLDDSKVGECQGHKVAFFGGCRIFAVLRKVYFGGGTLWLCGRCIQKVKVLKRIRARYPVSKQEIKKYKRD